MADSLTSNLVADLRSRLHGDVPALHDGKTGKAKCVACGNFNRFWHIVDACNFCQSCTTEALGSPVETTPGHCIDCIELKNALAAAVKVANEARECHDRDQDMRTMKLLIALSGHLPKWRADTDRIHDVLRRAVERLSDPMPPEEPTPKPERQWRGIVTHDPMDCSPCDVELRQIEQRASEKASAPRERVWHIQGAKDCEKCHGAGWLYGTELDDASEDTRADTMTKYSCDGEKCCALNGN